MTDDESILKKQWNQSIFFTIVFILFYLNPPIFLLFYWLKYSVSPRFCRKISIWSSYFY